MRRQGLKQKSHRAISEFHMSNALAKKAASLIRKCSNDVDIRCQAREHDSQLKPDRTRNLLINMAPAFDRIKRYTITARTCIIQHLINTV